MILLVSGATRTVRQQPHQIGRLIVPNARNRPEAVLDGRPWAMDNGAFNGFKRDPFLQMLATFQPYKGCLFVTSPDVVGRADLTLDAFRSWGPYLDSLGFPVALVAQDGLTRVPWSQIDALFIGGSTEFKLGRVADRLIARAKQRGKWVHMGRVNSRIRICHAYNRGCDSVDGTSWSAWPDTYIPKYPRWLEYCRGGE